MVTNMHVHGIHVFVGKGGLRLNRNPACSLLSDWPHPLVLLFVIPVHLYCAITLFPTAGNILQSHKLHPSTYVHLKSQTLHSIIPPHSPTSGSGSVLARVAVPHVLMSHILVSQENVARRRRKDLCACAQRRCWPTHTINSHSRTKD